MLRDSWVRVQRNLKPVSYEENLEQPIKQTVSTSCPSVSMQLCSQIRGKFNRLKHEVNINSKVMTLCSHIIVYLPKKLKKEGENCNSWTILHFAISQNMEIRFSLWFGTYSTGGLESGLKDCLPRPYRPMFLYRLNTNTIGRAEQ